MRPGVTQHRPQAEDICKAGVITLLIVLLVACGGPTPAVETPSATATSTATPSVVSQPTPSSSTPTAQPEEAITLIWWAPDFLGTQTAGPARELLETQLAAFERSHAGQVRIEMLPKARYGKGGLLDLLRTAQPVAPGILPDIVTLDVLELEQAVAAGSLQPLDQLLAGDVAQQLYPFAQSAGRFQGRLLAVQYIADLEHVVHLTDAIATPPQTWDDLLRSSTAPYLFPLGIPQPGTVTSRFQSLQYVELSHYLSAGAAINPVTRQLGLEEMPLLRLLTFYKTASGAGLLPPNALEIASTDTVWDIFAQGRVPLAQITARQYLRAADPPGKIGFAATPGWAAPAPPIASGWALAIVTTNPRRQQLAADLIAWLLEPQRAGAVAQTATWLPTSPAALKAWGDQPYYAFLDQLLSNAASPPVGPEYAQASAQLQKAVMAVLAEGVSPRDATAAALGATRP
ncbi:MAG: extracellular solute-binding protein [Anaerolineae bacterium]